jgi:hypothetical protein
MTVYKDTLPGHTAFCQNVVEDCLATINVRATPIEMTPDNVFLVFVPRDLGSHPSSEFRSSVQHLVFYQNPHFGPSRF